MSDNVVTWESLRTELQTALRTLAEGRRIDSALENELEDLGLAEYVQGAHATWATDKGYALLPAGEAVDEAEKMAVEYGDGYAAGVVDGIRDLIHDLAEAYDDASVGMRLDALQQVIEKYKTMYLK